MLVMQTELLPAIDQKRLATLEREIDSAVKSFITAGNALREIRDGRLYQETHETFEAYCKERWSFSRPRAYQLIEAAGTNQRLSKILDTPPTTESHTVEVAKAPEDKQAEVWQAACERAEDAGKPVTAKIIKETREELLAEPEPSKTPDSDGLFDTSDLGAEDETAVEDAGSERPAAGDFDFSMFLLEVRAAIRKWSNLCPADERGDMSDTLRQLATHIDEGKL